MGNMELKMKNKKAVIFGVRPLSSVIWYCMEHDSDYSIVAFTLDKEFIKSDKHEGIPVIPFEELGVDHPPSSVDIIAPVGYKRMNQLRKEVCSRIKDKGYNLARYISSRASIWPDLEINENVIIYEHTVVRPFSSIGKNSVIASSVHISHHNRIGENVFIAAGAVLGGEVTVCDQSVIGIGATLRDQITIAPRTFIGAGAVVVNDTESDCVYVGNPAKKFHKSAMEVTC